MNSRRAIRYIRPSNAFVDFNKQDIEQSIPSRFEQQVAKYPQRLALKTRTHRLSYKELHQCSNRIARLILSERGEGEEPVALLIEQGAPLIATILGVLKGGKFYVPMDPSHPKPRLEYILDDVQAELIVTDNKNVLLGNELGKNRRRTVNIDEMDFESSAENPGLFISPDALAYIFYTSGSTGRPKGVVDNHRNVLHNIMRYTNNLYISSEDRLTLLQSCSFSGSVSSLFCAVLNGAAVFPYNIPEEGMGINLARWLIQEGITIFHSVPMIFRSFLAGDLKFPAVRVIRLEGDVASKVDVELYKKYFGPECILVNGLGATETGITRQYFVNKKTELSSNIVPIGYPIEDMEVLLLDDEGKEVHTGHIGEIAIKSGYLSPDYWQNPELTKVSFLPSSAGGTERIYKTGDMGRMRPDGCLEYLGRKDFQLKILGLRVEPAEVETALLDENTIKEAVVTTRENRSGEPQLVAYLVPTGNLKPAVGALRKNLAKRLPDYMIPSTFVVLNSLPLNSNGKVDRRALSSPDQLRIAPSSIFMAPTDILEQQLAEIWGDLLRIKHIGVRDNFFELGGNSLLAARLFARIQDITGKNLSPIIIFHAPTIEKLAVILHRAKSSSPESPLVAIQPIGSKPPLFCVHDLLGNSFFYADLVRSLGSEQPFYGLQQVGLRAAENLQTTIEAMAAQYLVEIQTVQPRGPYFLGGFCFGGVVAFEMAHQLWAQGQEVALLALFSVRPDDFPRLVSRKGLEAYQRYISLPESLKRKLVQIKSLDTKEGFIYLKDLVSKNVRTIKRDIASKIFNITGRLWTTDQEQYIKRVNKQAFKLYLPQTYPGRVILFLGDERTGAYSHDPLVDWNKLASGGLVIHGIPGDDHLMLSEPTVQIVSEQLKNYLRE